MRSAATTRFTKLGACSLLYSCTLRGLHATPPHPPHPPALPAPLHLSDLVGGILKALTGAGDAMDGRRQVHAVHLVHILGGNGEDLHRKVARPTSRSD